MGHAALSIKDTILWPRKNVCHCRELHINSTMKATIRTRSIILQKSMSNLQILFSECLHHVSHWGPRNLQWPANVTAIWSFCCLQVVCYTFLYEFITKCNNYVQNIRYYSARYCGSCDRMTRICARPKKTGVLVVRN